MYPLLVATYAHDPYDELPYNSRPIEWTAPERLALCSLLHAGPRVPLQAYRVLELGCGDGANLLPLACYRGQAEFVGVDSSRTAIERAEAKRLAVGVNNLTFLHADFLQAARTLSGRFDFILVHGVFSWVTVDVREQLLALCCDRLAPTGLLYLNYNTKPGWNIRGMVRDFLRAQTSHLPRLAARAQLAREIAQSAAAALADLEHPYARLMTREWEFVHQGDASYIAHEFLAPDNHAFWRNEVLSMCAARGLHYVADADFNYASGRTPEDLTPRIEAAGWHGVAPEDTSDLFSYRQLHSPIFSFEHSRAPMGEPELRQLFVASALQPQQQKAQGHAFFYAADGCEVEAKGEVMCRALQRLAASWPRGVRVHELFADVRAHEEDLRLLYRHGLIDLRLCEPEHDGPSDALVMHERSSGGYVTDAYHRHWTVDHNTAEPATVQQA